MFAEGRGGSHEISALIYYGRRERGKKMNKMGKIFIEINMFPNSC